MTGVTPPRTVCSLTPFAASTIGSSASRNAASLEEEILDLFNEMRRPLLHHLLWMQLRPDVAEDLIQETFLRLFAYWSRGAIGATNLRGWVWRVAHNLGLRSLASSRRGLRYLELNLDSVAEVLIDSSPSPEQSIAARQCKERLILELKHLNNRERSCIHLRAQGIGYRQIAALLGIPKSTVSDTIRRVLSRVRG